MRGPGVRIIGRRPIRKSMDTDGQSEPSRSQYGYAAFCAVTATVTAVMLGVLFLARLTEVAQQMYFTAAMLAINIAALVFAIRAGRRRGLRAATRLAWRWIAAAIALLIASSIAWALFSLDTFPAPGDVLRLAFTPVMLVALLKVPRDSGGRRIALTLLLDVTSVVIGGAMIMWYFVAGPALTGSGLSHPAIASALAYPVGDLVLLFGVCLVLRQGVDIAVRRPLALIAVGLLFEIAGNTYNGYTRVHSTTYHDVPWQMACWLIGHALLLTAAFEQGRAASRTTVRSSSGRAVNPMPYLGILVGMGLLVFTAVRNGHLYPWMGVVAGSVSLTAIAMSRQVVALRENRRLAVTDTLTGLSNRAHLNEALDRALARSRRNGQKVAVLLADLNGFKQINDTLGHAAGDRMLIEFAELARRSVLGGDVVGRLGGDEFAIVLHDIATIDNAEAVVRRLRAHLRTPVLVGDVLVPMRAAVGIALSEPGDGPDEILHRADVAMYEDKRQAHRTPDAERS